MCLFFFFFNDTATTEIYTLSLHDALPISLGRLFFWRSRADQPRRASAPKALLMRTLIRLTTIGVVAVGAACRDEPGSLRSEEHTSELQSRLHLVCRLLLEKKKRGAYARTT